jgi:hypothetical protein
MHWKLDPISGNCTERHATPFCCTTLQLFRKGFVDPLFIYAFTPAQDLFTCLTATNISECRRKVAEKPVQKDEPTSLYTKQGKPLQVSGDIVHSKSGRVVGRINGDGFSAPTGVT